jgi:hypothetical protein
MTYEYKVHAAMTKEYPAMLCGHGFSASPFVTKDDSKVTCKLCRRCLVAHGRVVEIRKPSESRTEAK